MSDLVRGAVCPIGVARGLHFATSISSFSTCVYAKQEKPHLPFFRLQRQADARHHRIPRALLILRIDQIEAVRHAAHGA